MGGERGKWGGGCFSVGSVRVVYSRRRCYAVILELEGGVFLMALPRGHFGHERRRMIVFQLLSFLTACVDGTRESLDR